MDLLLQNIVLGISLAAPIGPANIAIIKRGLRSGFQTGFSVGLGVVTADTLYLLIVYLGLSPILTISIIQTIIWIFGALILLGMGYGNIKEFFTLQKLDMEQTALTNPLVEGFLINISNPMSIVWWIGVFGSSLGESFHATMTRSQAMISSLTIILGLLVWVFTIALLTHWGKWFLNEHTLRYISLIAGLLLTGFGLKFGFSAIISIPSLF